MGIFQPVMLVFRGVGFLCSLLTVLRRITHGLKSMKMSEILRWCQSLPTKTARLDPEEKKQHGLITYIDVQYFGRFLPSFRLLIHESIWVFPKIVGFSPQIIHFNRVGFSIINHPFWGTFISGNTHILLLKSQCFENPETLEELSWADLRTNWPINVNEVLSRRCGEGNHGAFDCQVPCLCRGEAQ